MSRKNEGIDSSDCPRFVAMVAEDYLESDNDLDVLLDLLRDLHDPTHGEDVVVWYEDRTVAAVLKNDGRLILLDGADPQVQALATVQTPKRRRS